MRPFDRGLLIIYTLILTLLFIILIPVLAGWVNINESFYYYTYLFQKQSFLFIFIGLMILAGGRLLWVSIKPAREQAVVHENTMGHVRISLTAIENLVEKVAAQNNGVREVKASVFPQPRGIGIRIMATVTPDINIPQTSGVIQEQIKERVLEVTGIIVQQVDIFVKSISSYKPRVE